MSPGLGEASLQSLQDAGTEQVRRKGISCLLGTTMFLLPSQLPAWEGVHAAVAHGSLVEGSRLRTAPFYSLPAGRRGAELPQEHRQALCGAEAGTGRVCEGQLPPQLPVSPCSPQAGASLHLHSKPLPQDCRTMGNSGLSCDTELGRGSVRARGSVVGPGVLSKWAWSCSLTQESY